MNYFDKAFIPLVIEHQFSREVNIEMDLVQLIELGKDSKRTTWEDNLMSLWYNLWIYYNIQLLGNFLKVMDK